MLNINNNLVEIIIIIFVIISYALITVSGSTMENGSKNRGRIAAYRLVSKLAKHFALSCCILTHHAHLHFSHVKPNYSLFPW